MTDETKDAGAGSSEPDRETSMGEASDWSTVTPPVYPPPELAQPAAPVYPPLEPLPQPTASAGGNAGSTIPPNAAPPPSSNSTAGSSSGYQPVYGSQPPSGSTSSPGGAYPPPPQPPPPGYQPPPPGGYPPPPAGQGLTSNTAAAISYITFIPAVIFLVMAPYNRDRFVRFHAWQCIALTIVWVIVSIIFTVLSIAGLHFLMLPIHLLVRLVLFVLWLLALIKASQGQWWKIPLVGDLAESLAGKI